MSGKGKNIPEDNVIMFTFMAFLISTMLDVILIEQFQTGLFVIFLTPLPAVFVAYMIYARPTNPN